MPLIQKVPRKLEELLGPEGTDQFVDFLNQSFQGQKEDVVQLVSDRFHRRVTESAAELKSEIADVRTEMAELRTGLKTEIAQLRTELKTDIANLRAEMKSDSAAQTRWILVGLLAAATLYPIVAKLLTRLFG